MAKIRHKVMVLSGKGGVGKSSVAASLALELARRGQTVGLLDVDFHGPSVPTIFGPAGHRANATGNVLLPIAAHGVRLMSIGFLVPDKNDAVIWRGPLKAKFLSQLLEDVDWGELDWLVMDFPPGTGDEALSACQSIEDADGGIVVTTPQEVALADCRRCIRFAQKIGLPVLGVVENMSGFVCPTCGGIADVFSSGGGEKMAADADVTFLGKIPLDPVFVKYCDDGLPYVLNKSETETAQAFRKIADGLVEIVEKKGNECG